MILRLKPDKVWKSFEKSSLSICDNDSSDVYWIRMTGLFYDGCWWVEPCRKAAAVSICWFIEIDEFPSLAILSYIVCRKCSTQIGTNSRIRSGKILTKNNLKNYISSLWKYLFSVIACIIYVRRERYKIFVPQAYIIPYFIMNKGQDKDIIE